MTFYVTDQNLVVLSLISLGAVFGLLRDVCGVLLDKSRAGVAVINITEFVLCLAFCFVYQVTVFVTNYGYARWYEIAGVAAGFLLYRMTLSKAVRTFLAAVVSAVAYVVVKVLSAVMYPFVFILKKLAVVFKRWLCVVIDTVSYKRLKTASALAEKQQIKISLKGFIGRNERIYNEYRE